MSAIGCRAEPRVFVSVLIAQFRPSHAAQQPENTGLVWRSLGVAGVLALFVSSWLALDCRWASAAAYTWDPTGSTSPPTNFGGGGTWDPSSTNWWDGTTTAAWSSGNDAWFTGPNPGGTVTLDAPQTVGNIVFSASGYILSGSTLTVSPANLTLGTITANQNATINSSIADNGLGVTFNGTHVMALGAAGNTGLTGAVTVNSGTLAVNGANQVQGGSVPQVRSLSTAAPPFWPARTESQIR